MKPLSRISGVRSRANEWRFLGYNAGKPVGVVRQEDFSDTLR
jgi:hypothetical protein